MIRTLRRAFGTMSDNGGMRLRLGPVLLALAMGAGLFAAQAGSIDRRDHLPYRRLTVADFRIVERNFAPHPIYTRGFIEYRFGFRWSESDGRFRAVVTEWSVDSGFDRGRSFRWRGFHLLEQFLQHEQGHLDLNEIAARELAGRPPADLPVGRGASLAEAERELSESLAVVVRTAVLRAQSEQDRYDRETEHGQDRLAQRRWDLAIARRLETLGIRR
jgi:hypothetical protein